MKIERHYVTEWFNTEMVGLQHCLNLYQQNHEDLKLVSCMMEHSTRFFTVWVREVPAK